MPYKITGKILDEVGFPLYQIAQISEIPATIGQVVSGNVWSDEETGAFTFMALDPNNTIKVEAHGYTPVTFKANNFPSVVKLQPILVIEGTVTNKVANKDNTLMWALAGIATVVAISVVSSNSGNTAQAKTALKAKKPVKPITVTV